MKTHPEKSSNSLYRDSGAPQLVGQQQDRFRTENPTLPHPPPPISKAALVIFPYSNLERRELSFYNHCHTEAAAIFTWVYEHKQVLLAKALFSSSPILNMDKNSLNGTSLKEQSTLTLFAG